MCGKQITVMSLISFVAGFLFCFLIVLSGGILGNIFTYETKIPNLPNGLKTKSSVDFERIQYIDEENNKPLFSSSCAEVKSYEKADNKYRVTFLKERDSEIPVLNCIFFYNENVSLLFFNKKEKGVQEIILEAK